MNVNYQTPPLYIYNLSKGERRYKTSVFEMYLYQKKISWAVYSDNLFFDYAPQKSLQFLVFRVHRLRPARPYLKFSFFFAMKRFPFATKIAGLIGNYSVLCVKRLFHICEAALSHHTLYMGNLVPAYAMYMYHVFPCWQKKRWPKKEMHHRTDF